MILWNIVGAFFRAGFNALLNWLERRDYDKTLKQEGANEQAIKSVIAENNRIDDAHAAADRVQPEPEIADDPDNRLRRPKA